MPRLVENGMAPLMCRLVLSHLYVTMCCKWCSWCLVLGRAPSSIGGTGDPMQASIYAMIECMQMHVVNCMMNN
ncbi:hypothetical protein V8C86DRAFT_2744158 [Haematococcus lacustris]